MLVFGCWLLVVGCWLLVVGTRVGTQGGNIQDVCKYGMNSNVGLLINSSRGIIYASDDINFDKAADKKAKEFQNQMEEILDLRFTIYDFGFTIYDFGFTILELRF